MDKKAQLPKSIFTLIDLFILAVMVFAFFYQIYLISASTWFEKRYLAKDIALSVDTLYASPYDITIAYPHETFSFSYRFSKNSVTVFDRLWDDTLEATGITSSFSEEKDVSFFYRDLVAPAGLSRVPLVFEKKEKTISPAMKEMAG